MGVELLYLYIVIMLLLGPGTMLYGILIVVRQRVRLTRSTVLYGGPAVASGIAMISTGCAFTCFLWYMGRFFPH
jgi:hypothetical protein